MKLRTKTALILGCTVIGLVLFSYVFARYLLSDYENLEKQYAYQNVQRALGAFAAEFGEVKAAARENAAWDDAYAFMLSGDARFIDKAFPQESFDAARLQFLAFVDLHGGATALRFHKKFSVSVSSPGVRSPTRAFGRFDSQTASSANFERRPQFRRWANAGHRRSRIAVDRSGSREGYADLRSQSRR